MELRKQGLEVPKEMLEKKFAHNRERHSKDLRRQHDFLTANYDAQQVLLQDIQDLNRQQAEQGLPTFCAARGIEERGIDFIDTYEDNSEELGKQEV